jgi:hypothetical protein
MGYYFCFKVLENSFQKTRMFFGMVGKPQYQEAIILYRHQIPPTILKKIEMKTGCFPLLKNFQMHIPRKNKERGGGKTIEKVNGLTISSVLLISRDSDPSCLWAARSEPFAGISFIDRV